MQKQTMPKVWVREIFANGDERCEVRWPAGAEGVDSPVDNWLQVRDVDLNFDPVTGEAVFLIHAEEARWESSALGSKKGAAANGRNGPRRGTNGSVFSPPRLRGQVNVAWRHVTAQRRVRRPDVHRYRRRGGRSRSCLPTSPMKNPHLDDLRGSGVSPRRIPPGDGRHRNRRNDSSRSLAGQACLISQREKSLVAAALDCFESPF